MCGIAAIWLSKQDENVCSILFDALMALQHRGQDAAGIVTCSTDHILHMRKKNGMVRDVFDAATLLPLVGPVGLAHCRYPTAGTSSCAEAQPLYTNSPFGICLAHNGNLTNSDETKSWVREEGARHFNTDSDSEVLLNTFAIFLMKHYTADREQSVGKVTPQMIFRTVEDVMRRCEGGYAVVAMIVGIGIVAFRDPYGIRPLSYGKHADGSYFFCSESAALGPLNFPLVGDVAPGEAMFLDTSTGEIHAQICHASPVLSPCVFEFVYLARPDSTMDKVSVYQARINMGIALAKQLIRKQPNHGIDVVVPVPDTGRIFALEMARYLNVPYREALVKNRYIARTFIMPGQEIRQKTVSQKLSTIPQELEGKSVLLVDDSIVRGNTSRKIVEIVRSGGAVRVAVASAAPPVRYPNVYGIDMPTRTELVAAFHTDDEVAARIGADFVIYQTVEDMEDSVRSLNPKIEHLDSSCFTGKYITGGIDDSYLSRLASTRNESRHDEKKRAKAQSVVEIHNNDSVANQSK